MNTTHKTFVSVFLLVSLLFSVNTIAAQGEPMENFRDGCVETYDPNIDYFPSKVTIDYAKNLAVEYFNNYKLVTILPWVGAESPMQYILIQCGTPAPEGYEGIPAFEIPIQRFVTMSTSMLPHVDGQGLLGHLVGVDTSLYTSNQAVIDRVIAGDIVEIGGGGMGGEINIELLFSIEPDLVMAQEFFAGGTTLAQLNDAGIPAVLNADYTDTSPLGQAEWGKYIALFFNTETLASDLFAGVAERYEALKSLTANVETRPSVITASPYSGTWYMPGGDSTIAQLLSDAGAAFLWADAPGTSNPLDFEVVLEQGAEAEFWVNINQFWQTQEQMLADDSRFAVFAAFQNGNLWNNNLRMNSNGGSDYFETGAAYPDLILADLIAIFHPELLSDHEFTFYQLLGKGR